MALYLKIKQLNLQSKSPIKNGMITIENQIISNDKT
jgi:hypothetical protein